MALEIQIKYFDQECKLHFEKKGDWIDVRSRINIDIPQWSDAYIPLGFAMKLPDGWEAILAPRSSTFKKFKIMLVDSIGVIDNAYQGDNDEWFAHVYAFESTRINKGDRICQFRIIENMPELSIVEVDKLSGPDRGGWGSTGHQ